MSRLIGGTLLVSGTTIGGAMLVLPVLTAGAGLYPSLALILVVWFFMFFSAFLILEISLTMRGGANMVTMATKTLGPLGKWVSWIAYLFLLYCLTAAYLAGSGELVSLSISKYFELDAPSWIMPFPMILIFGAFVYIGAKLIDYSNRLFMIGLVATYLAIVIFSVPEMSYSLAPVQNWSYLALSAPVVTTAFGFHIVIPSLVSYLNHDVRKLKICLCIGATLPLVVYLIWQIVMFSVLPLDGEFSLVSAFKNGNSVTVPLGELLQNKYLVSASRLLNVFAIITSFLGVTLSLSDFLTDGLGLDRSHSSRILVTCLTFIPPLFFVITYPRIFVVALEYAGIFVAILLGLLPIAMVWVRRYRHGLKAPLAFPGGKPLMIIAALVFIAVIVLQVADAFGGLSFLNTKFLGV